LSFSSEEEGGAGNDFEHEAVDLEEKDTIIRHYPKAFMNLNKNV
jgi:hypothetical protein